MCGNLQKCLTETYKYIKDTNKKYKKLQDNKKVSQQSRTD